MDEENCFTVARKPDPVRFCHIPRPQDCVVGPYGEWSPCKGCPAANQTRVRAVLVAPLNGGRPCPQLTDTRVCNPRAECLTHSSSSSSSAEDSSRLPSPEYKLKLGEWRRCEAPTKVVSADLIEARLNTPLQLHGELLHSFTVWWKHLTLHYEPLFIHSQIAQSAADKTVIHFLYSHHAASIWNYTVNHFIYLQHAESLSNYAVNHFMHS